MSKKRTRNDLRGYFLSKWSSSSTKKGQEVEAEPQHNDFAESLAERLNTSTHYLTNDGESWYLLVRSWMPSNKKDFEKEWETHPTARHALKLFGKLVYENRWSQAWGVSYAYSGSTNVAQPVEDSEMVELLIKKANELTEGLGEDIENPYQGCLQNWYTPDHTIGLHADDERSMQQNYPIFSLSWGGTRRFLLRPRDSSLDTVELFLKDGDLLVMGGTIQKTHRHEVPKRRKTMDPATSNRINWTIRAYQGTGKIQKLN